MVVHQENLKLQSLEMLRAVVADAYRVFGRYKAPVFPLDACTPCCMSEELEQEMRQLPLARLGRAHFYEYNTSAKGLVQPVEEVRYLLPRLLDLMAQGVEVHHSIELSLDRLGRCAPGSFSAAEKIVLDRFARAYFQALLHGVRLSGAWGSEALSVLLMFHIGGLATAPLLDLWLECDDPESTAQFVEEAYCWFWEKGDYSNAFADDRPAFRQELREWILSPACAQRFVQKLLAPEFLEMAERRAPMGYTAFSTMVDAAFYQLTQ